MGEKYSSRAIQKYFHGKKEQVEDYIAHEFPLTLFLNGREIVTIVCLPDNLLELGVGFLLSEGFIRNARDIMEMDCQEKEGLLHIKTDAEPPGVNGFLRRNIASCCGKGRAGLYFINDARQVRTLENNKSFRADVLLQHMELLENSSQSFQLTGGVHSAALADQKVLFVYEDIGRHNAVDKVLGAACLQKIDTTDKCLVFSGRISSEIVIKAARTGIQLILSKAAPTDLAIDLAVELNITLVGFARKNRMNIYSCSERVC